MTLRVSLGNDDGDNNYGNSSDGINNRSIRHLRIVCALTVCVHVHSNMASDSFFFF